MATLDGVVCGAEHGRLVACLGIGFGYGGYGELRDCAAACGSGRGAAACSFGERSSETGA